jgi:hypothetical protein
MEFVINRKNNILNICFSNEENIEEMEKFLTFIIPCYEMIKTKIHSFNNVTFQKYIEKYETTLENDFNQELVLKQQKIKQLEQKIVLIEEEFEEQYEKLKRNIQKQYETETALRLDLIKNNVEHEKELIISEKNKVIELLKQKIEYINTFDHQFQDLKSSIQSHFEVKQLSTSEKGKIGEEHIMNELEKLTMFENDAIIENVSGKSETGDIFLKLKELKCCIEVKNHTIDIRQTQIDKFQRDIKDLRYNSGIFISLFTPIVKSANINDFDIRIIDKKPCIYIVNLQQNPHNLYLAIKTLLFLMQNQDIIQNESQNYIEKLTKTINNCNKLQENCNIIEKSVKNSRDILKNEIEEVNKLLKITEHNDFKCNICEKSYKTMKSLKNHKCK